MLRNPRRTTPDFWMSRCPSSVHGGTISEDENKSTECQTCVPGGRRWLLAWGNEPDSCGKVDFWNNYTERGLDCLIEAKVAYPSYTVRWVKNSMSKITITSQWNSSYPLYFFPIQLLTRMTRPQTFEQDVAFWKVFERFVRALILALDIEVILSQSPFMNKKLEINPRISLVMLGIQILGYCFPLISASGIVLKSKESDSYRIQSLTTLITFLRWSKFSITALSCVGTFCFNSSWKWSTLSRWIWALWRQWPETRPWWQESPILDIGHLWSWISPVFHPRNFASPTNWRPFQGQDVKTISLTRCSLSLSFLRSLPTSSGRMRLSLFVELIIWVLSYRGCH